MIATFFIEIALAFYTIFRYKLTPITHLAVMILVSLAVFQLAEYNVCEGSWGVDSLTWARIGYVAITALPPLGLHLIMRIVDKKNNILISASYLAAIIFAAVFLFVGNGLEGQVCQGNYVIFAIAPWAFIPYTAYYYGLTMFSTVYAIGAGGVVKAKSKKISLYSMAIGYLAFMVPTTAVNLIDPATRAAIPSVMCGFAVIFAIILAGFVVPRYYSKK
jgi:hypothetical protein